MAHPNCVLLIPLAERLGLRSPHRVQVNCADNWGSTLRGAREKGWNSDRATRRVERGRMQGPHQCNAPRPRPAHTAKCATHRPNASR